MTDYVCLTPNKTFNSPDKTFYVSYNSRDAYLYGDVTTALVWGQMEHFYILYGDHRKEYKELMDQGWQACFDYFAGHKDLLSKYSETENCR